MMTQTHLLIAAALLARPQRTPENRSVVAGALIPDAGIYVLFVFALVTSIPQSELWNEVYWGDGWQSALAVGNSIPVYLSLLLVAVALRLRNQTVWPRLLFLFALAGLFHIMMDFPVHADDAHRHLWPISDWRFHSPLSYWDSNHHGGWVSLLESLIGLISGGFIALRFKKLWITLGTALLCLPYVILPIMFALGR